jgi:hypothetical protein
MRKILILILFCLLLLMAGKADTSYEISTTSVVEYDIGGVVESSGGIEWDIDGVIERPPVTAAAGGSIPLFMHHYKQMRRR